ncbi:MAG: hypothetical protein Q9160_004220 [Pyrenula sp. 1 TL-2023]
MASDRIVGGTFSLPPPSSPNAHVSISALEGGHLTLPEQLFVTNADPHKRTTVPSLAFLIQHKGVGGEQRPTRLLFDLGIKRDLSGYRALQQEHITHRQPTAAKPDVADSLRAGGTRPEDIDHVVLSHVHWDHVGTPDDFSHAEFVVGSGTLHTLEQGAQHYPAELFNVDLLPRDRTAELPPANEEDERIASAKQTNHKWENLGPLPAVIDFFGDRSLYVVNSPGHLQGHVNLLARVDSNRWVYLGGDCCHDTRILRGEKDIAMYDDGHGGQRSVHMNLFDARQSLEKIRRLIDIDPSEKSSQDAQIEVIVAHDGAWKDANPHKFLPGYV